MLQKSKKNSIFREPLAFKYLRQIEKKYQKEISELLSQQVDKIFTKKLVSEVIKLYKEIEVTKRLDERLLAQFIAQLDILLTRADALSVSSNVSKKISSKIYEMMLETGQSGLDQDRLEFAKYLEEQGQKYKDNNIKELINKIKNDDRKIDNYPDYLQAVSEYVNDGTVSMNDTQQQRIRNYLVRQLQSGLTEDEILAGKKELLRINQSRAWSIARTSIIKSKNIQLNQYYSDLGIISVRWKCYNPEDHLCLMNCGAVRNIGDQFPSGVTESPAHVNCYHKDVEILTTTGWKNIQNIQIGDVCLTIDEGSKLSTANVVKLHKQYTDKLDFWETRSAKIPVTANHNLVTVTDHDFHEKNNKWRLEQSQNIKSYRYCIKSPYVGYNYNEIGEDIDGRFWGWYMSEGSTSVKKKGNTLQVSISQYDKTDLCFGDCKRFCEKYNYKYWIGKTAFYIVDQDFCKRLKRLGKSYEKKLDFEILDQSVEFRKSFLEAFIDGDGSRVKGLSFGYVAESISMSSSSWGLIGDLSKCILSLGLGLTIKKQKDKGMVKFRNGTYKIKHLAWCISLIRSKKVKIDSRKDKKTITYNDIAYCCELDKHHNLFIKYDGQVLVCGNCQCTLEKVPVETQIEYDQLVNQLQNSNFNLELTGTQQLRRPITRSHSGDMNINRFLMQI